MKEAEGEFLDTKPNRGGGDFVSSSPVALESCQCLWLDQFVLPISVTCSGFALGCQEGDAEHIVLCE